MRTLVPSFAWLAFALAGALGCGSLAGDENAGSNRQSDTSARNCRPIDPGENICLRNFDEVDVTKRPGAIDALDRTTRSSDEVRELLVALDQACTDILDKHAISGAPEPDAPSAARAHCRAAARAIGVRRSSSFRVGGLSGTCTRLATAGCAPTASRIQCTATTVDILVPSSATDAERVLASALATSFGPIVGVRARLPLVEEAAGRVSRSTSSLSDLPACLIPPTVALFTAAIQGIGEAIELTDDLFGSLGDTGPLPAPSP